MQPLGLGPAQAVDGWPGHLSELSEHLVGRPDSNEQPRHAPRVGAEPGRADGVAAAPASRPRQVGDQSARLTLVMSVMTVLLGLLAALSVGTSDFLGGLASRRADPVVVTAASSLVGLLLAFVAALAVIGEARLVDLAWGALGGVVLAGGLVALYAGIRPRPGQHRGAGGRRGRSRAAGDRRITLR